MTVEALLVRSWRPLASSCRPWERRVLLGASAQLWNEASAALLNWEVKTRSGFKIDPQVPAVAGQQPVITIGAGLLRVVEPVAVMEVAEEEDWVGFSYRTLPGHPVQGVEAFILERVGQQVFLRVRSVTEPSDVPSWRRVFWLLIAAQWVTRWRYLRALKP
ncbi:DUF1990 family protein [Glutamicibacter arilaitensis]|uniref:DUF1990 family protein n=1 Tax=Glutamicibacter arilaitensis TaxID=256701 RepID=A0A4Y8TZ03_9MICC|nr:DUF1990 family protein [Glutamicibacter arilaitensis]TFH56821.1 DUF1990 family protein [Glutamicibacter arilaitensis]